MAFNSIHFLIFFPVVLTVYWSLRRNATLRIGFLLVSSYYFYMSWNVAYAALIFGSTVLDFFAAQAMASTGSARARRTWLIVSLTGNLGVLFVFKYYNFFIESVGATLAALGLSATLDLSSTLPNHSLLLPVGISFYTFQTLSYTIDVYRGAIQPSRSFVRFALFVSFFPQLVAGPIVRASTFLPQLEADPKFDDRRAQSGLGLMLMGLFKKVCIADVIGTTLVDPAFADPALRNSWVLWMAMYGYAFQIYYDFCGYSDMAIGAARMLGFDLPINFRRPYSATSVRDFWQRWHISLSTWLRDYLYVPLGGSRGSSLKVARNLAIVMILGGLWHGAAWGFLLWGALHGLLLVAGRIFYRVTGINADRSDQPTVARIARVIMTFHLVAFCLVLFRAPDFDTLSEFLRGLVSVQHFEGSVPTAAYLALAIAAAIEWMPRAPLASVASVLARLPSPMQACVVTASLLAVAAIAPANAPFIYFQF